MKRLSSFTCEYGQVYYTNNTGARIWWDMVYHTTEDKLNLFLYAVTKASGDNLFVGYQRIHIVEDYVSEQDVESCFTSADFTEILPYLSSYGISTDSTSAEDSVNSFITLSIDQFDKLSRSGVSTLLHEISEYTNTPEDGLRYPTKIFVEHAMTLESISKLELITHRYLASNPVVVFVNISHHTAQDKVLGSFEGIDSSEIFVLDGKTCSKSGKYIWWEICNATNIEYDSQCLIELYNLLAHEDVPHIISVSSEFLQKNTNAEAEATFMHKRRLYPQIPPQAIYILALVHLNCKKSIEFTGFPLIYTEQYMEAIAMFYNKSTCELGERVLNAIAIPEDYIYFTKINSKYTPALLKHKNVSFSWVATKLTSILKRIAYNSTRGTFEITSAIADIEPFSEVINSEENIVVEDFEPVCRVLSESLCAERENPTLEEMSSFVYSILRLIEQKLLNYTKIISLADIICFRKGTELYIGVGTLKTEYELEIYICTDTIATSKYLTSELIPFDILLPEDRDTDIIKMILQKGKGPSSSEAEKIDVNDMVLLLTSGSIEFDRISAESEIEHVAKYLYYNLRCMFNYQVRRDILADLCTKFNSFGLRSIGYNCAPINIFGGVTPNITDTLNKIAVHPIVFSGFPEGVT